MDRFTLERVASMGVVAALDLGLWRVLSPARRQLVAALAAAFIVGLLDVTVELVLGLLGVWRYDLPLSVAGIPVDLLVDVSLVALAVGLGAAAVERTSRSRGWLVIYVAGVTLALGTWALFKNTRSSTQGMISFAGPVDVGTAWFVAGNYAAVLVLVAGATVVYRIVRARLDHRSGGQGDTRS